MMNRRDLMKQTTAAGAGLLLASQFREAFAAEKMMTRPIPSSNEQMPVIGLGSSATFQNVARSEDVSALRDVLTTMVNGGGKVFDTAPSYGAGVSEQVAGNIANEAGIRDKIFWATKVNVAGRGGGNADPAAARKQIDDSFAKFKVAKMDLIQVHNLGDIPTQLGILKELKAAGKVRYIGTTSTSDGQYEQLAEVMRKEPLDFIGIDYAIDNRNAEQVILPLARERKIGVLVYVPFGRANLFSKVKGKELPGWAAEFDAKSWAQFFLKFCLANPAVTCITPATSKATNMLDNMGGGVGKIPTAAHVKQMIAFMESV